VEVVRVMQEDAAAHVKIESKQWISPSHWFDF